MATDIFSELMNFRANSDFDKKKVSQEKGKTIKPSERLLMDIKSYGFDMSQMEAVLKTRGNQLIISCAGSGKTTSLVFKIIYDTRTGWSTRVVEVNGNKIRVSDDIWVCTFLRTGAEELEYNLKKWQSKLHCIDTSSSIKFSTLHAEFKRALTALGVKTDIISSKENTTILKNILNSLHLVDSRGKAINSEDVANIESALIRTRNVLDPSRYESDIYDEYGLSSTIIDNILLQWSQARRSRNQFDFEDLQEILYDECYKKNNANVINFLSSRYNFIYIDEFQDTSQLQYELIKVYANGCKQVVAIGDDDQTIYSWRGSDNNIITKEFEKDFSPVVNQLSINFRCPENILNAIKPSIEKNSVRFSKELKAHQTGGKVRVAPMPNYQSMIELLSDCIYNDIKHGRSVAILCRVNSDGLLPALILDKIDQFTFSISGDGMTLNSYIGRTVLGIVKLFTEKYSNSVKNALEMLTWNRYEVQNLIRVCQSNKISIWSVDKEDLTYSCPSISSTLLEWRNYRKDLGDIKALGRVLAYYRYNVFEKDTQFNMVMRSVLMSVESLLGYFDYTDVQDFLEELEDINERLLARKGKKGVKVQIATVHEFKGKEADSVYIWNDSVDVFPQKKAVENGSIQDIEEERRVHYIACTRAREISTIIYKRNSCGAFVSEMDLSKADYMEGKAGVVLGALSQKSEQEKNMDKFKRSVNEEEAQKQKEMDDKFIQGLVPDINADDIFGDDNEFWGKE